MSKFKDVFVVDDDKVYHFIIKKLLTKNNIDVKPSFYLNGLEAIEEIKGKIKLGISLPDLILLDINMPIMDGWQFLDELKKTNNIVDKNTTIYLVSSSDSISDVNKAKEYQDQIKDFFFKPMTAEDLWKIF
ncbi:response regulator [Flavobacterium luteum]|uniref:Response regulator n=1 Tax=Flavobacterium luteum TaxID=2026654 RepID=A0A7J5A9R8_9FLAO|nr:response regulator [Flavobacterium luteum]KAB1154321.1 response regulator [Flavobacterium luteum]